LVIPAFNEEARLPGLLAVLDSEAASAAAEAGMRLVQTLIVDDGSTDGTAAMLREAEEGTEHLEPVLEYAANRGKGAAFAAGVAHVRGDYVLLADVDLSTPLGELSKLSGAIAGGADIAIGSRAVVGAEVERGPAHRKLTGALFNRTMRVLTGLRIADTQNGFKLFPAEPVKRFVARQICTGFAFDVELLMRADQEGLSIAEVPIRYVHDAGSSVRVLTASVQMLREVGALAYHLRGKMGSLEADPAAIVRRS
jgi:dolichyl-phosphate beta-glucosyltransferase